MLKKQALVSRTFYKHLHGLTYTDTSVYKNKHKHITHTNTHKHTYMHTIIYAYNHIHTYIYTNHGFNVVCPKSILIHHCIYLKRNAHILTHVYIHISWLYKTPKSGNGNKISDKMWHSAKFKYLKNEKW